MCVGSYCQAPGVFSPGNEPISIAQGPGWTQGQSVWVREKLTSPGFDTRLIQPEASHYTDQAIVVHMCIYNFR